MRYLKAFSVIFCFIFSDVFAQDLDQESKHASPKVFLHLSHTHFQPADTLWYKVDLNSELKDIFYVELLTKKGEVLLTQRLQLIDGKKGGNMVLPEFLSTDVYFVRGYPASLQASPGSHIIREIIIVNLKDTSRIEQRMSSSPGKARNIEFYPEGGSLIEGIPSKVAFKIIADTSCFKNVYGLVLDEEENTIASFKPILKGTGIFVLRPEKDEVYKVRVYFEKSLYRDFPLPEIRAKGQVIHVNSGRDYFKCIIQSNGLSEEEGRSEVTLAVWSGGNKIYEVVGKLRNHQLIVNIPKKELPEGILEVRFTSVEGKVLKRMVYNDLVNPILVSIKPDKIENHTRSPIKVEVSLADKEKNEIQGTFSISAALSSSGILKSNGTGLRLLINSSLYPQIGLNDYFSYEERSTLNELLLLSQSIRTEELVNGRELDVVPHSEEYLTLKGTIKDQSNARVKNRRVYLLFPEEGEYYESDTDIEGNFNFSFFPFNGRRAAFLLPEIESEHEVFQIFHSVSAPILFADSTLEVDPDLVQFIEQAKVRSALDSAFGNLTQNMTAIEIKRQQKFLLPNADRNFDMNKYEVLESMEETFREILFEGRLMSKEKVRVVRTVSKENNSTFEGAPLIILDGRPTFNSSLLLKINPAELDTVSFYNSAATLTRYGSMGKNGIIKIVTKGGTDAIAFPNTFPVVVEGFNADIAFMPKKVYPSTAVNYTCPNLSPLLYWSPEIKTDLAGKAQLEFYSNDLTGGLIISVEGRSKDGVPFTGDAMVIIE